MQMCAHLRLHSRAHRGILLQWVAGSFSYQMTQGLHVLTSDVCFAEHVMASCSSVVKRSLRCQADINADMWAARSCLAVNSMASYSAEQHCLPVARAFAMQI